MQLVTKIKTAMAGPSRHGFFYGVFPGVVKNLKSLPSCHKTIIYFTAFTTYLKPSHR
jgi:hypothetical protein